MFKTSYFIASLICVALLAFTLDFMFGDILRSNFSKENLLSFFQESFKDSETRIREFDEMKCKDRYMRETTCLSNHSQDICNAEANKHCVVNDPNFHGNKF